VQREKDQFNPDKKIRRQFESELNAFIALKNKEGYKVATLQVMWASIRSFFEIHYIPLLMRKGDYPKGDSDGVKRATDEAIKKALANKTKFSFQSYPLIMFAKDSGLRISDIVALDCRDIPKQIAKGICPIQINVITEKTNLLAKIFIGKEAIEALKEYFKKREAGTIKWHKCVPPEKITPTSPLFKKWSAGKVQRMNRISASHVIRNAFVYVGENHMSAHSLRKRLQTKLEKGGMPTNWVDQVLGHKLINSRDAYSLPTDEELTEAYMKAYPLVAVLGDTPIHDQMELKPASNLITPDISKALTILAKFAQSLKE
jgi:integrase